MSSELRLSAAAVNPWDGTIPCHPIEAAQVVYVEVPKAGCTSVKRALAPFKGVPPGPLEDIHHWYSYTWASDLDELHRWLDTRWRDFLRITVVRSPIDRFESYFHDLVGLPSISRYSQKLGRQALDIHAIPQVELVGREPERFSFIGRTEDMARLGSVLSAWTGEVVTIPHANRQRETPRSRLTPIARARVIEFYRDDYQVLGYAT